MGVYRCKSAAYETKRDGEAGAAGVSCGQLVWGRVERSFGGHGDPGRKGLWCWMSQQ